MSVDVMSNMLSSIKNASMVGKANVEVMHTKQCEAVVKVLAGKGYVSNVKVFKESGRPFKKMNIELAYDEYGNSIFKELRRVSKPGRRVYKSASDLGKYLSGYGLQIVSTSRGVMSGEDAKTKKLGGELICQVS